MTFTVCPKSGDLFYIVSYYIKWVTTSWAHSIISHFGRHYRFETKHQIWNRKTISGSTLTYIDRDKLFFSIISAKMKLFLYTQGNRCLSIHKITRRKAVDIIKSDVFCPSFMIYTVCPRSSDIAIDLICSIFVYIPLQWPRKSCLILFFWYRIFKIVHYSLGLNSLPGIHVVHFTYVRHYLSPPSQSVARKAVSVRLSVLFSDTSPSVLSRCTRNIAVPLQS